MKKNILRILGVLLFAVVLTTVCFAASAGVYNLQTEKASVTLSVEGITAETTTVADKTYDDFYPGANKVEVACTDLTVGDEYVLLVLEGSTTPSDENIVYIDQKTAVNDAVQFTAYPMRLEDGKTYYLMLSGTNSALEQIGSFAYVQQGGVVITTQPDDYSGAADSVATFRVAAEGEGLKYQWQISDDNGATWSNSSVKSAVYTTKLTAARDGRMVRCVVTDESGFSVTSETAVMRVSTLKITTQPKDYAGKTNSTATFTVAAEGEGLKYQWQISDDNGASWTNSSVKAAKYSAKLTAAKDGRMVRCVVTDQYGASVISQAAVMRISGVTITTQPKDYNGKVNSTASFNVAAEGEGLTYQWQISDDQGKTWTNSSVKAAVYTTKLSAARDGRMVRCIVTDQDGNTATSSTAVMRITGGVTITTQPKDYEGKVSTTATFTVAAEGTGLTYQWQVSDDQGKTWTNSSVKSAKYSTRLTADKNGRMVRCVVTDQNGTKVTSSAATMRITGSLLITTQPKNYTGKVNSTASFNVVAEGVDLTYQWQISDDQGKTWTNSSVKAAVYTTKLTAARDGRMVRCVVTDQSGSTVTSQTAVMSIG